MKLVVAVLGIAAAAATIINDLNEAIDGVYTFPFNLHRRLGDYIDAQL